MRTFQELTGMPHEETVLGTVNDEEAKQIKKLTLARAAIDASFEAAMRIHAAEVQRIQGCTDKVFDKISARLNIDRTKHRTLGINNLTNEVYG